MRNTIFHSSLFYISVLVLLFSVLIQVHGRQIDNDDGLKRQAVETRRIEAASLTWHGRRPRHPSITKKRTRKRAAHHDHETAPIVGSRLPDCSHACGPCSPCRLVMISFVCSLGEAETCPMAYKCMCNSKSYPVP